MIIFPIEVAMVEAYNVRLPLLDRKDEIRNRDTRNNSKDIIFFAIELVIVEVYNVRLPLLDRKNFRL